jgi:large conductance mechanosensitive channel
VLVIPLGAFLTAVLNFLIIAVVLFLIVKAYNRFLKKEEAEHVSTDIELLTQIRDELRTRST